MNLPTALRAVVARVRRWPLLAPHGRMRLISLVVGVLVLLGSVAQVAIARMTALPDNAVLRVGDTIITEEEFQERVDVLKALYGLEPPKQDPKRDHFKRAAAKSIAVSLILDRAAQDRNVVVAEMKAREALNKIIEEQLPDGYDGFVQFLKSEGISEHDVLDEVERQLATSRLFQQVTADVDPVTDAAVRQTYQERKKQMIYPERRQLRNIVVSSKAEATDILRQARAGADFAELAAKYSRDASTKSKGGDLGALTADQLAKNYADSAFAANEPSFFGPVKTRYGWNVGQIVRIEPAKQLAFNEVKGQLQAELDNKRKLDAWRTWLANQIKDAEVEYAADYLPADPDAPPAKAPSR